MMVVRAISSPNELLDNDRIRHTLSAGLGENFKNQRILVLIPDHTRTLPLPKLFRLLVETLQGTKRVDFMVALGTHPALSQTQLYSLVGISPDERSSKYKNVGLLNHRWDSPDNLIQIGAISGYQIKEIAGENWHPSLDKDVPVKINRKILEYDHLLILGPTFPHEVVGFSGGAKYLFPGISGPEMINTTHWLSALVGVMSTIGINDTPVRAMIHAAADCVPRPITLIALVVVGNGLAGIFIGDHVNAWQAAAELSAERHILWYEKPFQRVLSWALPMYDELWTAAKAMYKLEPVVADGGEMIIYAPHLEVVSQVHGKYIFEIGYHVLEYFLKQWDQYKHIPLGVLAHSTHVRGAGRFEKGIEVPRLRVILASQIPKEDCERLSLAYMSPDEINPAWWQNREEEGLLFVPKAGETLFRVKR